MFDKFSSRSHEHDAEVHHEKINIICPYLNSSSIPVLRQCKNSLNLRGGSIFFRELVFLGRGVVFTANRYPIYFFLKSKEEIRKIEGSFSQVNFGVPYTNTQLTYCLDLRESGSYNEEKFHFKIFNPLKFLKSLSFFDI